MTKRKQKKLMISSGKLSVDDKSWDIEFWQSCSFYERAKVAFEMALDVYKMKNGGDTDNVSVDRSFVLSGKLPY
ncbi:MAG: hypothetical protein R3A13_11810 [Bdellovibrionota bacterium]